MVWTTSSLRAQRESVQQYGCRITFCARAAYASFCIATRTPQFGTLVKNIIHIIPSLSHAQTHQPVAVAAIITRVLLSALLLLLLFVVINFQCWKHLFTCEREAATRSSSGQQRVWSSRGHYAFMCYVLCGCSLPDRPLQHVTNNQAVEYTQILTTCIPPPPGFPRMNSQADFLSISSRGKRQNTESK